MRHPTEGVLRRLIDEPEGVPSSDREHVGACQGCRDQLAAVAEDAGLVEAALAADVDDVDVDAAWERLSVRRPLLAGARRLRPLPVGPERSCAVPQQQPSPSPWS
jgi:predicted anti-sigma-YlaC factor YlaD